MFIDLSSRSFKWSSMCGQNYMLKYIILYCFR